MKKVWNSVVRYIRDFDKILLILCLTASALGVLVLMGCADSFGLRPRIYKMQFYVTLAGIAAVFIMSRISYEDMAKLWKVHVPIAYLLVFATFIWGYGREGADDRAWLNLPGGFSIQPAEFLKLSFILSFAYHLSKTKDHLNSFWNVVLLCLHGALPVVLIHIQGDDGTALVFFCIFLVMIFISGLSCKYILPAMGAIALGVPLLWKFVMNYDQKMRFLVIFDDTIDPLGIGYQQRMSKIALGSGEIWGTGLFSGNHHFISEIQNDMIFAFIGNAMGLIGCVTVILLILAICLRCIVVGMQANDLLGKYICFGVSAMFFFQSFINIGMCLGVLPIIGITLPFFSAGGSSVLAVYLGLGLVFSVHMNTNRRMMFE